MCASSIAAAPAKKSKRSSLQAIREGAVVRTYVQQQRNLINQPARFLANNRVSSAHCLQAQQWGSARACVRNASSAHAFRQQQLSASVAHCTAPAVVVCCCGVLLFLLLRLQGSYGLLQQLQSEEGQGALEGVARGEG